MLKITQGDTGLFTITVTLSGAAVDMTSITSFTFTATGANGVTFSCSTLDGSMVVQSPSTAGVVNMIVAPSKTSPIPPQIMQYGLVLVDAIGEVTTTETGNLQIVQRKFQP